MLTTLDRQACLGHNDIEFYQKWGYLRLKNVVPEEVLQKAELVASRWVEELIESWREEGLLKGEVSEQSLGKRLLQAWHLASKPVYMRSPRRDLVSLELYEMLRSEVFADIASTLLHSQRIIAHSVFNLRPKAPAQHFTDTPWHQDAQYWPEQAHQRVLTIWFPLCDVGPSNSCLMVAPGNQDFGLQSRYEDPVSKFVGIRPQVSEALEGEAISMRRGDVLCFNHSCRIVPR